MAGTNDMIGIVTAIAKSVPDTAGAKAVEAQEAAEAAQAAAEAVLESIPDDYSTLSADVGELKTAFRQYLIHESGIDSVTLTNVLNAQGMYNATNNGDGFNKTSFSSGVALYTAKGNNQNNPYIKPDGLNFGEGKWLLGLKMKITKVDETLGDPTSIRLYLRSVLTSHEVVWGEWIDLYAVGSVDFLRFELYIRGFETAPTAGQFTLEVKNVYAYEVTGLSDDVIDYIVEHQSANYADGTVTYGGDNVYTLDDTLTLAGKIPDSKAVGDAIAALGAPPVPPVSIPFVLGYINNSGEQSSSTPSGNYCITDYVSLDNAIAISYTGEMGSTASVFWFNESKTFISYSMVLNDKMAWFEDVLAYKPANAKYVRLQSKTLSSENPPEIAPEATIYYDKNYIENLKDNIVGDGVADDTIAVQKLVNMSETVTLPSRSAIKITSPIYITLGHSKIINGNGTRIVVDGDFYALSIRGTLVGSSSSTGMNAFVMNNEAATLITNFRITSANGISGGGIEATKALKLKIIGNYIYNTANGIRLYGDCRDLILSQNLLHSIYASGILLDQTLNLHQCNIINNIIMYAHDCIRFNNSNQIANFQIVGNDLELGTYPPETYQTATCIQMTSPSTVSLFGEIEITGNTLQGHNLCAHAIEIYGSSNTNIMEVSIGSNHISNTSANAIKMENVKNISITGNTYKEIGSYVFDMDGECTNIVIVGDAARVVGGKIHAESTATLNNIKCKNTVYLDHDSNDIETADVTNVNIDD